MMEKNWFQQAWEGQIAQLGDDSFERLKEMVDNKINDRADDQQKVHEDRRLAVLSIDPGSGKSALCNTILGRHVFESRVSAGPVTKRCRRETVTRLERNWTLIDTPAINNKIHLPLEQLADEIVEMSELSAPGPHCILLAIPIGNIPPYFKHMVINTVKMLGEELFDYILPVFTKINELERDNILLDEFIRQDEDLAFIIQKCGGRFAAIDNQSKGITQVKCLRDKIDDLVLSNNEGFFSNGCFRASSIAVKEKQKIEERRVQDAIRPTLKKLEKTFQEKIESSEMKQQKVQNKINDLEELIESKYTNQQQTIKRNERRHTAAIHRLTVETSDLRDELRTNGCKREFCTRCRYHPYDQSEK